MSEIGVASYYSNDSVDKRWGGVTKSGEKFDENKLTAAVPPHRWKELKGKKLRVTNQKTGKTVVVKVNDTGGFEKYGRSIDLSKSAFQSIANPKHGTTNVEIEVVEEKDGNDTRRISR
jgi:rare lipoprotein A